MCHSIESLKGKILKHVKADFHTNEVVFTVSKEEKYKLYHEQDCCEIVSLVDVCGDLKNLRDSPILVAEERTNSTEFTNGGYASQTWTFYELATIQGSVTLRFLGESNGYYSESVNFMQIPV